MKGRARIRPGQAPRPSPTEMTAWRRLMTRAEAVAKKPLSDPMPFVRAAEKAGKAVAPVGHQGADSAFIQLVRMGKGWLTLSGVERQQKAGDVRGLLDRCRAVLEPAAAEGDAEPWWSK